MKIKNERVSVIIPVTRPKKAQEAIEAVQKQGYPKQLLEIIPVSVKGKLGPGERRNLGAQKTKGEILIFLDDDCLPQKEWLRQIIKALKEKKVGAVGGMIRGKSRKYFAQSLDFACFTFEQSKKRREIPVCAASLAMKKQVFQKAGGFNEKMRIGEDTDLCMRLRRLGYKTIYEPKIKVFHNHSRETLRELLFYQYNNGRTKGLTIENRYPDNFWFKFLKWISHPGFYWFFVLLLAVLATLVTVAVNIKDHPKVIFYSPAIFLGKLALQLGVFVWTLSYYPTQANKK